MPAVPHRSVPGPCVGEIEPDVYEEHVDGLASFLAGDATAVVERLTARCRRRGGLEFEQAARIRDQLTRWRAPLARQEWSPSGQTTST